MGETWIDQDDQKKNQTEKTEGGSFEARTLAAQAKQKMAGPSSKT
jgi:hypothetical protein